MRRRVLASANVRVVGRGSWVVRSCVVGRGFGVQEGILLVEEMSLKVLSEGLHQAMMGLEGEGDGVLGRVRTWVPVVGGEGVPEEILLVEEVS